MMSENIENHNVTDINDRLRLSEREEVTEGLEQLYVEFDIDIADDEQVSEDHVNYLIDNIKDCTVDLVTNSVTFKVFDASLAWMSQLIQYLNSRIYPFDITVKLPTRILRTANQSRVISSVSFDLASCEIQNHSFSFSTRMHTITFSSKEIFVS